MSGRFTVGQVVEHRLFNYRGVVVDMDARFSLSEEWYEKMARSKPPKDQPWYKVLVHDTEDITYVAERNLVKDPGTEPIQHPLLEHYFNEFRDGYYCDTRNVN